MKEISNVTINGDKITLKVHTRDQWGITDRRQMTFDRRHFESALRTAEITVPWQEVAR